MGGAQTMDAQGSLLPLPRPLMVGEVLDAAFRLFRAGLLRCLPYSGLAVLVLELPTLYSAFFSPAAFGHGLSLPYMRAITFVVALLLFVALLGVITLRLNAVSRGIRPRFRAEVFKVLKRWPSAAIATLGALGFPLALFVLASIFNPLFPSEVLVVLAIPLLWPTALFAVSLPAFWCDGLGPVTAIVQAVRVSRRRSWRMVGAVLATACMLTAFYVLTAIIIGLLSNMMGRADLFLMATVSSMLLLMVGAFGVPFVLAVLIVAYEDLKLREARRPGAAR